jgi:FkbM family methyltransferase
MINICGRLGRIARLPLRGIPKKAIVPILSGPNRGYLWIVGAGQHGCWLGTYEQWFAKRLLAVLREGMTAFDVGAHSGYYTLMMSRAVGRSGRVFAFEPNALNAAYLRRHVALNRLTNIQVVETAITDREGTVHFRDDGYNSRIAQTGRQVRTTRLDSFPIPDLVKMDIEGAEVLALRGASKLLKCRQTIFLLAVHSTLGAADCTKLLIEHAYKLDWFDEYAVLATPF